MLLPRRSTPFSALTTLALNAVFLLLLDFLHLRVRVSLVRQQSGRAVEPLQVLARFLKSAQNVRTRQRESERERARARERERERERERAVQREREQQVASSSTIGRERRREVCEHDGD